MDMMGLNWPQVNEDAVREFAGHVRTFAGDIGSSQEQASATIQAMAACYQGSSYDRLAETWSRLASSHMTELMQGCEVAAVALDIAADLIVAAKMAVIAQLVFVAIQLAAAAAAAVFTLGAAAAAEAALIQVTKKVVNELLERALEEIVAHLAAQAVEPLEEIVGRALKGLVLKGVEAASDAIADSAGAGAGTGFSIHPDQLLKHADDFKKHSDEVAGHAAKFSSATAGVSFG
ncbi:MULTISPECIES: WXG100 family type VII secretion target [unclassified Streptomyces]|uniref:WXG100 family type VII secretion target n=1 Tax=unclassified Streptomyces TaxID=2593676 RepID=UPI0003A3BE71|nr:MULTISPECIES: WXG100 family type VII secretion target [unclassified Streptomyces]